MARWGDAFAGAGLGLLVGVLLGLSAASVAGTVVAALAAALAAFFGLASASGSGADRPLRVGAFGLACVAGVVVGLTVRTGAVGLAPSVRSDVAAWVGAGFSDSEARDLVAFQRLGVRPRGREVGAPPAPGPHAPVLFSDPAGVCGRIARLPDAEVLRILRDPSAGPSGMAAAAATDAAPAAARPDVLHAAVRSLCGA